MSEKIKILYYALWMAHPLLQAGIAAAMLRSKLHRKFMFFFAYIATQILTFAVIFPSFMRHNYSAYFYLYWVTNAIGVVLGFMVIREVFLDVFRPFHTLRDLGTVLFKWAGLVMLLVAGVVSVSTTSREMAPWMLAIITTQRCVRIIQVGMVLFLLFFAHYLGVSRKQHSFGIALGFGGYAMIELALIASWVGDHMGNLAMDLVNMAAYNACLVIWLSYALAKSPARDAATNLLQPQRWEQSLTDIHHPLPANSLIPMFEGMVDRALSRTQVNAATIPGENERSLSPSEAGVLQPGGFDFSVLSARRAGSKS
jgi:hypothetical protein